MAFASRARAHAGKNAFEVRVMPAMSPSIERVSDRNNKGNHERLVKRPIQISNITSCVMETLQLR